MKIHHQLPDALLDLPAHRLHEHLSGPSLYLLPGEQPRPLFISVLLHGNEYSGWEVVTRLLKQQYGTLPRRLALLIGNVAAAHHRVRHLDYQPDYNRCWPGASCDNEITQLFHQVVNWARSADPIANIDIHNNTGNNPLYAIINSTSTATLRLAADFSPLAVYTRYPKGTQSDAFSAICPSVTLECARPGDPAGINKALELVQRYLAADAEQHLHHTYTSSPPAQPLVLYRMRARITVPRAVDIVRLPGNGELRLAPDLDQYNFRHLPAATVLGQTHLPLDACLQAQDSNGSDVTRDFFELNNGALRTTREIIPGMFTSDPVAIQRDCLGYIMEEIG